MANMRHIVIHIEKFSAVAVVKPDAFAAHNVHWLIVKKFVRRTEYVFFAARSSPQYQNSMGDPLVRPNKCLLGCFFFQLFYLGNPTGDDASDEQE